MLVGRVGAGTILVAPYIYVVGGLTSVSEIDKGQDYPTAERTNERYNILTDTWEQIATHRTKGAKSAPSLVTVQNRKWLY